MKGVNTTELEMLDIAIGLWQWLYDNPLKRKWDYPRYYDDKINDMEAHCPCCSFYAWECNGCPLDYCIDNGFSDWDFAETIEQSQSGSGHILALLKNLLDEIIHTGAEK